MNPEAAEKIALSALVWLAGDEELTASFLGTTGASAEDLRNSAQHPEFLGALLDFIMMSDDMVLSLCAAIDLKPEAVLAVRAALPGGDQPNWT